MSNSDETLNNVTGEKVKECGFMPWTLEALMLET